MTSLLARLGKQISRPFAPSQVHGEFQQEILLLCNRTLSLEELLRLLPEKICAALGLSTFHVFLQEGSAYVLKGRVGQPVAYASFAGSSLVVLRLRRSREPAPVVQDTGYRGELDGWQLLAAPGELGTLHALETDILLPLEGRTGLIGFLALGRAQRHAFSPAERSFLRDLGPQMGRGFETAQLVSLMSEQAVERARLHRELEIAREVQERLLPGSLPPFEGITAAAVYRSAEQVGGDYYDFFVTAGGLLCMVIADVSGKGVPAALLMATLRATLHTLMSRPHALLQEVMEQLNALLYKASGASRYATVFLGLYDRPSKRVTYVNAGHNPPVLLRSSGALERLTAGGTVVGLLPDAAYVPGEVTLNRGDILFAYTDGVTEATNTAAEEWGERGLFAALLHGGRDSGRDNGAQLAAILQKLDRHVGGAPQNDDITLISLACGK